jgi:hypothetical protein
LSKGGNKCLVSAVAAFLALSSLDAIAADLPKLSYINENKVLRNFPLGATKTEVFEQWGAPTKVIDGLPLNSEVWTYELEPNEAKYYEVTFRDDAVYDVVTKYRMVGFKPKSARKMQGVK